MFILPANNHSLRISIVLMYQISIKLLHCAFQTCTFYHIIPIIEEMDLPQLHPARVGPGFPIRTSRQNKTLLKVIVIDQTLHQLIFLYLTSEASKVMAAILVFII